MAIKLAPDFKEFLRLLRGHGVRHLVIGGRHRDLADLDELP